MLFNFKSKKKYFSTLLVLAMLFSSMRLDSLLVFAHSLVNNDENIVYHLDDATADYFSEIEVEDVDETVSYDDLELDLIEDDDELEFDADYLEDSDADAIGIDTLNVTVHQVANFAQLQNAIHTAPTDGTMRMIVLTANINLTSTIVIQNNRNIILTSTGINQFTLTKMGDPFRHFYVNNGSQLTLERVIIDSGHPANSTAALGAGSGIAVMNNSHLTMNAGVIIRNIRNNYHGGVYINNSSFTMNDGQITNNTAGHAGAGVTLINSSFTMNDGLITNNTVLGGGAGAGVGSGIGGGVYSPRDANSRFTMNGGLITNNTSSNGGGVGINYGGGEFIMEGGTISNNWAGNGGGVSISDAKFIMRGGIITQNTARLGSNNGGGVVISYHATFIMEDGLITNNTAHNPDGIAHAHNKGGGVAAINGGRFIMLGGSITGNTAANYGGGVAVANNRYWGQITAPGEFIMEGGTISGNNAGFGGGVHLSNNPGNSATLNSGTIANNTAANAGGGVQVNGGTFNMRGNAVIENNIAGTGGGGVQLNTGTFNMEDSAHIRANRSLVNNGGGAKVQNGGTFRMRDNAQISDNHSESNGGGVFVQHTNTTFEMSGNARISDNEAAGQGGGIWIQLYATLVMNGGEISGNAAPYGAGGGISATGGANVILAVNPVIANNTAGTDGGGIFIQGAASNVQMTNGTISGNNATLGGGMYISSGLFNMNGGSITNNFAARGGGGINWLYDALLAGGTVTTAAHIANNVALGGEYDFTSALEMYPTSIIELFGTRVNPSPWNTRPAAEHVFNMNDINVDGDSIAVTFLINLGDETFPDRPGGMFDMLNVLPQVSVQEKYVNFGSPESHRFDPQPLEFRRVFTGWTLDPAGNTPFNPNTPITANTRVYAQWLENHTVSFMSNVPGNNTALFDPLIIPHGYTINNNAIGTIQPTPPIRYGFGFTGWNQTTSGAGTPFDLDTPITNNMTVFAQWQTLPPAIIAPDANEIFTFMHNNAITPIQIETAGATATTGAETFLTVMNLPAGLSYSFDLTTGTGQITGTPNYIPQIGYDFTVIIFVENHAGYDEREITIRVREFLQIEIPTQMVIWVTNPNTKAVESITHEIINHSYNTNVQLQVGIEPDENALELSNNPNNIQFGVQANQLELYLETTEAQRINFFTDDGNINTSGTINQTIPPLSSAPNNRLRWQFIGQYHGTPQTLQTLRNAGGRLRVHFNLSP